MSPTSKSIICPKCGATMNWHADKVVQGPAFRQGLEAEAALGGVVLEMYSCPACGANASRAA
jgi:ribosomal protein S27AE